MCGFFLHVKQSFCVGEGEAKGREFFSDVVTLRFLVWLMDLANIEEFMTLSTHHDAQLL